MAKKAKKVVKKATRKYTRRPLGNPEAPKLEAADGASPMNEMSKRLMDKLTEPRQTLHVRQDSRSMVLGALADTLNNVTVAAIQVAQAAVQAPNYTDSEDHT